MSMQCTKSAVEVFKASIGAALVTMTNIFNIELSNHSLRNETIFK